jgi:hypothetical protein
MLSSYVFPKAQFRAIARTVLYVIVFVALVLSFLLFLRFNYDISLNDLTRDFSAIAHAPVYTAFLSQLGIFFWAGTATICILSGALLSGNHDLRNYQSFFYASAGISLMLGLDDIFLFHESVFPDNLGIPEKVVFLSYGIAMVVYGVRYLKLLLATEYVLFALAIGFFGLSILSDFVDYYYNDYSLLLEDGLKFTGLIFWTSYYFRASKQIVKPLLRR